MTDVIKHNTSSWLSGWLALDPDVGIPVAERQENLAYCFQEQAGQKQNKSCLKDN